MRKTSPFGWISQYYFGFFFVYGVYTPFWALWLESQSVSAGNIGIILGLAFATRCVANFVLTPRIHRVEHYIPAIRILTILCTILMVAHGVTNGDVIWITVVTVLFNLCFGPLIPLSDSVANYYIHLKKLDYGRARLWGSLAFIVGSLVVGWMAKHWGNDWILYTALIGMAATLLLSLRLPDPIPTKQYRETTQPPKLMAVLREGSLVKFLLLISLIQGSHAAYYSFSSVYWKSVGYSEEMIGYLWSLGVIAEICVFAVSKRLFIGWSTQSMFVLSAVAAVVRWCLTAMTTHLGVLVVVQMLHCCTYAVAHLATMRLIQRSGVERMVVFQSLYNAIPLGAVIALMTALSGWGYEQWHGGVFWAMAFMGVCALLMCFRCPELFRSLSSGGLKTVHKTQN
jgi:PPP family 3-phenylpropionic acid transporter